MNHKIPENIIHQYKKAPSDSTVKSAVSLHENIRSILGDGYETFLQGSYRNDTCISDLNDVDIVAVRKETYSGIFSSHKFDKTIFWNQIFSEIEERVALQYGSKMERGDKCIKIKTSIGADVVPAVVVDDHSKDPVAVYSFREGRERLNYPRIHYENGKKKHQNTNDIYKPTVRLFKNWTKNHFGDLDVAPSFYVESLVYSVPDKWFVSDLAETFLRAGIYILENFKIGAPVLMVAGAKNIFSEWDLAKVRVFMNRLGGSINHVVNAVQAGSELSAMEFWRKAFNDA